MKIIYIYVHDYGQLKNVNFNLGGSFSFDYSFATNKLAFTQNQFYIPNFFNILKNPPKNSAIIQSLSAVVGENGSGKTTFFDYIKSYLVRGAGGFTAEGIIAFEDSLGKISIYRSGNVPIENMSVQELETKGMRLIQIRKRTVPKKGNSLKFNIPFYLTPPDSKDVDYIFLSNIFDRKFEGEVSGLYNVSTNFLIRQDIESKIERKIAISPHQTVDEHHFSEIMRELSFINEFRENYQEYLSFKLPSELSCAIILNSPDTESQEFLKDSNQLDYWNALNNYVSRRNEKSLSLIESFVLNLTKASLINFFNEYFKYYEIRPYDLRNPILEFEKIFHNNPPDAFDKIIDRLIEIMRESTTLQKLLISLKKFINLIGLYIKKYAGEIRLDENVILLNLASKEKQTDFFEIYQSYRDSYLFDPYLNFSWTKLSTGEKALISIYSRLFYMSDAETRRRGENLKLKENVVILIDEGELYLHPFWQRELVFQLLTVIPIIFKRQVDGTEKARDIQLIFATNSPLIISDIPAANIVFLKKELQKNSENITVSGGLSDHHQTFAANIHTLLADSFFMKNGVISELAKTKINEIIKDLTSSRSIDNNRSGEIRKTIQQIGEPILKHKLTQIYNDRFNLNIHNRLEVIERTLNIPRDDQD